MQISLKAARINAELKQSDVAAMLGVTKKTVASWENNKSLPRIDKIEAICTLYGVTYDDIRWGN